MDTRSRIHHVDQNCCFASRDDVLFVLWRGPADHTRISALIAVIDDLCRKYDRVSALTMVIASDPLLIKQFSDEQLRAKYNQLAKKLDGVLFAHAFVLTGSGFVASLVRSATVGLGYMFRSRVAHKTFDDLFVAARWLASQRAAPKSGEAEALEALLRDANSEMDRCSGAALLPRRV